MLSKLAVVICLALFALPLAARAEMPGQPCKQEQVGTTKMADDKQNIIACLLTGDTTPGSNMAEWKSFSGGGGGITGGCWGITADDIGISSATARTWGKGATACNKMIVVASPGYSCGQVSGDSGPSGFICVKN